MFLAITALQSTDIARIEAHLLRLLPEDRSLRFSAGLVTDETVRSYVSKIRFGKDVVMGLVSKRGVLVGFAHGCVYEVSSKTHIEAAFSVDAEWRGHGFATRLMACVQACAAASGGATVVGQCAVRNLRMRRVFEHAGMTVTREEDELLACGQVAASNVAMELARAA